MKADVTAENRPAYSTPETNQCHDRGADAETNTHEDQGGIQILIVLLHKVTVVLVGFALELVVEFDTGAACRSKEVWKERWQRFEHSILQARNEKRGHQRVNDKQTVSWAHAFGLIVASPMMSYRELGREVKESSCSIGCGKGGKPKPSREGSRWWGKQGRRPISGGGRRRASPNVNKGIYLMGYVWRRALIQGKKNVSGHPSEQLAGC